MAGKKSILRSSGKADKDKETDAVELEDTPASEITPEKVSWLWQDKLLFSQVNIIQGDKRVGKSTWLRAIAAHVSGGPRLPGTGKLKRSPGGVLYYSGEEDLKSRVVPGLIAAGADMGRVFCADVQGEDQLQLPSDLDRLARRIDSRKARLVIIDPIFAFSDGTCDLEGPTMPARRFMKALFRLAQQTGVCLLLSRNLTKIRANGALASGRGSAEIGNAARAVLHLAQFPAQKLWGLAVAACNDGRDCPTITYRFKDKNGAGIIDVQGSSDTTADELAEGEEGDLERSQLERAKELIRSLIPAGETDSRVIKGKAEDAMISVRTLQKAALQMGVQVRRKGSRDATVTFWSRPRGGWPGGDEGATGATGATKKRK